MEQLNFASVKDTDKVYRILGDLINANREFQIMITVPRDGKNVITEEKPQEKVTQVGTAQMGDLICERIR